METCDSISFRISSIYESIYAAINGIFEFIRNTGRILSDEVYFDIKVILNEILVNAIKHGNNCDCSKKIDILAELTKDGYLHFVVRDEGAGFDLDLAYRDCGCPDGDFDISSLEECGRGIFIVRNLCDRVEFSNRGSTIEVYKKI